MREAKPNASARPGLVSVIVVWSCNSLWGACVDSPRLPSGTEDFAPRELAILFVGVGLPTAGVSRTVRYPFGSGRRMAGKTCVERYDDQGG